MSINKIPVALPNERIQRIMDRRQRLVMEKRRNLYYDSVEHGIYQWSPGSAAFAPATGKYAVSAQERVCIGDHDARVGMGYAFPAKGLPSEVNGLEWDAVNWAKDYAWFLDNSPAEVYPDDEIVGEFHWRLDEVRQLRYPNDLDALGMKARALGAGGNSLTHTVVDFSIGLPLGWSGILEKIRVSREKFRAEGVAEKVHYLDAAEIACEAIIRFVKKHADRARELLEAEEDPWRRKNYAKVAEVCDHLASQAPGTYREALQFIEFYQIAERSIGHGNGYGRFDQYMLPLYRRDMANGVMTRDEARNMTSELLMKYGGNFFNVSGRKEDGTDATNELSYLLIEAYDMVGGHQCMDVLWHSDIDRNLMKFAAEVNRRQGSSTPVFINQDILRRVELNSGYKPEDVWNVCLGGCQWFCVPGKEYCDQDKNCLVLIQCLLLAFHRAVKEGVDSFEGLWALYDDQVAQALNALRDLKNAQYALQPKIWPEITSSFQMWNCIESGVDVTERVANYAYTSVNLLGFTNVADSLFAIQKVCFEEKRLSLAELEAAMENNWAGHEDVRQRMLNAHKFGNDLSDVDAVAVRVANHVVELFHQCKNSKGYCFRPSLFHFMGHIAGGPYLGVTPDGRQASEPLAQGCNPMHGRNTHGITATMSSLMKLPFTEVVGGICQLEIEPSLFDTEGEGDDYLVSLLDGYFLGGGSQVVDNIVSLADLEDAMIHPEKHQNIVVKVTGYSAHFVQLDKSFQQEIINRTRHTRL